jgi:signal transduction histidine kinase
VVTRQETGVAVVCAAWAAVFLAGEGAALAFAPLLGLAVLPYRRRPVVAALAVAAVAFAAFAAGVSEENPATLAAGFTVVYAVGRHVPGPWAFAPVVVLALALIAYDGFTAADAVFVLFILTATWTCGRLVRRHTARAREAADTAARLAARDPAALAAEVVAEERARLAGEALAVIRRAVEAMHADAVAAEPDLDPNRLAAIQDGGRAAVAELRRLLGLLRSEPSLERRVRPAEPDKVDSQRRGGRRLGWRDAALAAGLMALALVDVAAWDVPGGAGSVALTLAFAATAGLARPFPAAACLLAALPPAAAAAFDAPLAYGFSTAVACGVLAWWAGADGRPRALLALAVLAVVTIVVVRADSPGNEGILLGAIALTGVTGHAWGRRDREGRAAGATAAQLRAEHAAAAGRAVREERLRLARELHDVASHAVGAMVLQAGAALALRERDPGGARAAVRTIQNAGAEAMAELETLFGLLDAGAVGPAGHAAPAPAHDLGALAARMRAGGLVVELTGEARLPADPVLAATAYRVVQEALTNAARYAPGSRVEIAVEDAPGGVLITVADDGPGAAPQAGGGFGLVGLAERVRALGGELSAGPRPGRGFAVEARLPGRAHDAGATPSREQREAPA